MCIAYPGKIVKIKKESVVVDYGTEQRIVKLISDSDEYSVGDFVIVQAGFVVEKVPEKEALSALAIYSGDVP
ncbi:MAG: HypC/HybG/HupF family hydrogenase formation chaperone [Candidatus Woesearchaeota archaeon]